MESDQSPSTKRSKKRSRPEENNDTGDDISFLEMDMERESVDSSTESCPMCHIDAVIVPQASAVTGNNEAIRKIMNMALAMAGSKLDEIIFKRMAEEFNRTCYRQMNDHGQVCELWTQEMVSTHMRKHVPLIPRIMFANYAHMLDGIIKERHQSYSLLLISGDQDDAKKSVAQCTAYIKSISECVKTQMALVSKYRECVAEDSKANGAESLWISTLNECENDNTTEQIMISMYQNQSTAGPNDRPVASRMFDAT